jgi:threonine/homoserine/homoserine lactone efflux protein
VIVIGLFLIPGPAVLLIATRTAQCGRKAGIIAGLGIATGDIIHTLFAAIGLSAILITSSLAFTIVKFIGAAYLIYLGVRSIIEKPSELHFPNQSSKKTTNPFSQAILIEVLNPKTALFFLSFLPQFVQPERGSSLIQFLILGFIFVFLGLIYTTFVALSVQFLGQLVKRISWFGRWSRKIAGVIYISLGLKVAIQSRQ